MDCGEPEGEIDELDPLSLTECGRLLRALSDPVRLRTLALLRRGPLSVTQVAEALGLAHYQASRHLSALHEWSLLERQREQQRVVYALRAALISEDNSGPTLALGCCTLRLSEEVSPIE